MPHCQPGLSLHFGNFSHNSDSRSNLVSVSLSVIKYLMALLWELAIGGSVLQCLRFELPCSGQFCGPCSIVHHVSVVCYVYLYALHFTLSVSQSLCLFLCPSVPLCVSLSLSLSVCLSVSVSLSADM